MHYNSRASREREEKGSQREPTGAKRKPNGSQRGTKRRPKRNPNGVKMKQAPPKAAFAEQERKSKSKECQNGARIIDHIRYKSMKKQVTKQLTKITKM